MKLAIFGGTFDPIHCAHVEVASEALIRFQLDRVLFIPAAHPPHKTGTRIAPYEDRLRMVELACQGNPHFGVSRLEEGKERSYTINTVLRIRETLQARDRLFFLIGTDAFAEITTWHQWKQLLGLVEFIVVSRPGHQYEVPEGAHVHRLDSVALAVSSSEIRTKLARGESVPEVPLAVMQYIQGHGLYAGPESE